MGIDIGREILKGIQILPKEEHFEETEGRAYRMADLIKKDGVVTRGIAQEFLNLAKYLKWDAIAIKEYTGTTEEEIQKMQAIF